MLRLAFPAEHPLALVVGGGDAEHVDGIIAGTGVVLGPRHREGAVPSVHDLQVKVLAFASSHPEVEPLEVTGIICRSQNLDGQQISHQRVYLSYLFCGTLGVRKTGLFTCDNLAYLLCKRGLA